MTTKTPGEYAAKAGELSAKTLGRYGGDPSGQGYRDLRCMVGDLFGLGRRSGLAQAIEDAEGLTRGLSRALGAPGDEQ